MNMFEVIQKDINEKRDLLTDSLLREIKEEGNLSYLVIDKSVYAFASGTDKGMAVEAQERHYRECVGDCNIINESLSEDGFITFADVKRGDCTCISYLPLLEGKKILLQYVDPVNDTTNTTVLLKMKYTPVLKACDDCEDCEDCDHDNGHDVCGRVEEISLQCWLDVVYGDYECLPSCIRAFTAGTIRYELYKSLNEKVEGIIEDKYNSLYKLLKDRFKDDDVELHIKFADISNRLPF